MSLILSNKDKGLCVKCSQPFKFGRQDDPESNVYSIAGVNETRISGFCERCFDELFEGVDSEMDSL